jgi:hypothetical protein
MRYYSMVIIDGERQLALAPESRYYISRNVFTTFAGFGIDPRITRLFTNICFAPIRAIHGFCKDSGLFPT